MGRRVVCAGVCLVQRLGCAGATHRHHVDGGLLVARECIALALARAMVACRIGGECVGPVGFAASRFLAELCGGGYVVSHACFAVTGYVNRAGGEAMVDKALRRNAPLAARTRLHHTGAGAAHAVVVSTSQHCRLAGEFVCDSLGHVCGDAAGVCRCVVVAAVAVVQPEFATADGHTRTAASPALGCVANRSAAVVVGAHRHCGWRVVHQPTQTVATHRWCCIGDACVFLASRATAARCGATAVCRHRAGQRGACAYSATQFVV